jgi:nitroimidazol reductase NimA-like FMN-containing flavoprotein (pyridoxamine 5'-phosphate oxidase superfamily)
MIRSDRKITDRKKINEIIKSCLTCRLGLAKENKPYIVPISFGYDGEFIYLHTAPAGKKVDYISSNKNVCFEFDINVNIVKHESIPCKWTVSFQSVIGFGVIEEIILAAEKIYALNKIMNHYSGSDWPENKFNLHNVRLWKIKITEITGKETRNKV